MKRPKSITTALAELSKASDAADKREALGTLRTGLESKSQALVVQAAELVARLELNELSADLRAAYDRFSGEGMSADKHCRAKTAIVQALHRLKSDAIAVFLEGMCCYWPERPWGQSRDEAVALRVASAIAYAEMGPQTELDPLVDLLMDPVSDVRMTAVRAIVALGGPRSCLLLRFKTLIGDDDANVIEECFAGLLDCDKERYLPFVAKYLDGGSSRVRVAAALSLGRTRDAKALDYLAARWRRGADRDFQRDLLISVALLRNEPAIAFLLALLDSDANTAHDALLALSHLQVVPQVRERVEAAVKRLGSESLREVFDRHFRQERQRE
jgi:HEAT repeat protein